MTVIEQDTPMITVIGLDGERLGEQAFAAIAEATCVAGAERHLDAVALPDGARRLPIRNLADALKELLAWEKGPAVVLASGDPGFFGIVRALREQGTDPRVLPAVSSVATAFARIGLPWDDAVVVSAHGRADQGRSARRALAAALAHPKAAILTAPGAAEPGAFLPDLLRADREVYVAQRLGTPDEAVTRVAKTADTEREWARPNVVLAVDPDRAIAPAMTWMPGHQGAPDGWALPEEGFEHRGAMITKSEVRAVALAHLAPRPGTVVWDIGAGSGSVAIECARFGAYAVAFEKNPGDCRRIRRNARAHGVVVDVHEGRAPEVLAEMAGRPAPDAIFFGGGDDAVVAAALRHHRPDRVVAALASVDRICPTRDALAAEGYTVSGTQLQASRLAGLPNGSLRLAAANPVTLVWGVRGGRPGGA
ncbi:precorrin-6y C5,15-methyltransferase (decarboxylating) subunit CbiE [Allosalinactinospora lopnorensis]|uniref:precorrin-6y C5,15-methyltransferase (decarboxylating) subunit CbiE n=1 Tax=Allosalinactinospora lopnorensis TaxID=1352348 RepID=UPI000ACF1783|nr:precorrin-6y C5,15-methyltransferase (decarboxylating) subunit CbiE [Allosalinactinospora lopnorensis]